MVQVCICTPSTVLHTSPCTGTPRDLAHYSQSFTPRAQRADSCRPVCHSSQPAPWQVQLYSHAHYRTKQDITSTQGLYRMMIMPDCNAPWRVQLSQCGIMHTAVHHHKHLEHTGRIWCLADSSRHAPWGTGNMHWDHHESCTVFPQSNTPQPHMANSCRPINHSSQPAPWRVQLCHRAHSTVVLQYTMRHFEHTKLMNTLG
jgi:hypothetical protein